MKRNYLLLQQLLVTGQVNIEDYYVITFDNYNVRLQGKFTMSKHVDLLSKGFKSTHPERGWMCYKKQNIVVDISSN